MFEGLIEFIEQTVFGLVNKITAEEEDGLKQVEGIVALLLGFASTSFSTASKLRSSRRCALR